MFRRLLAALFAATVLISCSLAQTMSPSNLPDWSGKYYLTAIYSTPFDQASADLQSALNLDEDLSLLRSTTVFNEYMATDPRLQSAKWQTALAGNPVPFLMLQDVSRRNGTSEVVFMWAGEFDYDVLADDINSALIDYQAYLSEGAPVGQFRQRGNCPGGRCNPQQRQQQRRQMNPPQRQLDQLNIQVNPLNQVPQFPQQQSIKPTVKVEVKTKDKDEDEDKDKDEDKDGDKDEDKKSDDFDKESDDSDGIPIIALLAIVAAGVAGAWTMKN